VETAARTDVVLSRGLIDETGSRHRRATIRALAGREEAALAAAADEPGAQLAHELLAMCIERLGGYREVTERHTAALSRGDRSRLALWLRQLMSGDRLSLTLRCPNPACGELADLDLRVSELLGDAGEPEPEWIEVETPDGRVRLRPPTGLDDEACETAVGDRAARSALLWGRLISAVGGRGGGPGVWRALQPASRELVACALGDSGSLLDLSFVSPCPSCRAWIELELDPFALLVREVGVGADRLLAEVHCLAFHYGWSEGEILGLPRTRRWRYLELLRNQLEGRPLADL
jgi:hypothetical protein